jgi:DNA invertase Pin-like site-specific DNA recombinase
MSDINELFRKDPLSCSNQDIRTIVQVFREKRAQFVLGNKQAGKTSSKMTAKETEVSKLVDLSNLDLGV